MTRGDLLCNCTVHAAFKFCELGQHRNDSFLIDLKAVQLARLHGMFVTVNMSLSLWPDTSFILPTIFCITSSVNDISLLWRSGRHETCIAWLMFCGVLFAMVINPRRAACCMFLYKTLYYIPRPLYTVSILLCLLWFANGWFYLYILGLLHWHCSVRHWSEQSIGLPITKYCYTKY